MSLSEKYSHKAPSDTVSVTSRTTSDYFPQSYKRPAPYLLWDDNIVPIHFQNTSTFSYCRLFLAILITLAVIGVVVTITMAIYLGMITSYLMDEVTNVQSFDGRLRVTDGDIYVSELDDSSSLEFQLKAKRYETMLNVLLLESSLKDGYKETEVVGFKSGSLIVFFRVNLDRRKMPAASNDMAAIIHGVIVEEVGKTSPRVLKDVTVDVDSVAVWDSYQKKKVSSKEKHVPKSKQSTNDQKAVSEASTTTVTFQSGFDPTEGSFVPNTTESEHETETSTVALSTTDTFSDSIIDANETLFSRNETESLFTDEPLEMESTSTGAETKKEMIYGPWTPISPAVEQTRIHSDIIDLRKPVSVSPSYLILVNVSTFKPFVRPVQRAEALTSGVASEIPFNLEDFLSQDDGRPDEMMSDSEQISTAVRPDKNFPMEANVAAMLLLHSPPSSRNTSLKIQGLRGTETEQLVSSSPPRQWSDNNDTGVIVTKRPMRRYPPRFSNRRSTRRSSPSVVGHFVPPYVGSDFRVTSAPISPMQDNRNSTRDVSSILDDILRIITSRPIPKDVIIPETDIKSSVGETVIKSNNFVIKAPKRLASTASENEPFQSAPISLTTQGWVPVPVRWKGTTTTTSNPPIRVVSTRVEHSVVTNNSSSFIFGVKVHSSSSQNDSVPVWSTLLADHALLQHETGQSTASLDKRPVSSTVERDTEVTFDSSSLLKEVSSEVNVCSKSGQFQCRNGACIAQIRRCNQMRDCSDNSDEDGCTCADYLHAQFLNEKICDGVVDCWDYSDENRCSKCSPDMYVCPNSNVCIKHERVCDALIDCPTGEDEKYCVRVAANESQAVDGTYHQSGYLMMRKNGKWGLLCVENFGRPGYRNSAPLGLNQLASSVCQALTFSDYVSVERERVPPRPYGLQEEDMFYQLTFQPAHVDTTVGNVLEFNQTSCRTRDVVWMQCKNLECGVRPMAPSARIVGGANALAGSWPWQAAMYKSGEYMCGATLINDRWLISAAHCFYNEIDNYWTARLGMLRRGSQAPFEQINLISHIIIHPHYIKVGFVNDVSLLRLQKPVTFSDYVRPVCLPSPSEESVYDGRVCTVVGWGQLLETGHIFPDTLQEVELPIFTSQECRKKTVFLQTYQITENMFCAGYDRGGRDACLGDSGGPLVCQEPTGKWSLVGITSNGFGCARAWRPGIYTKVANYYSWINQVMDGVLRTPVRSYCNGHRCQLGKCLPPDSVCNGYVECVDGSDERDCFATVKS